MKKLGLLLLPLLLTACPQTSPPVESHPMTEAEVGALYRPMADVPLPSQTEGELGESYTLTGRAVDWRAQKPLALYVQPNRKWDWKGEPDRNGELLPDGTLQPATPVLLQRSADAQPLSQILGMGGTACPVNTLTLSSDPQLNRNTSGFVLRYADITAALKPQTSQLPVWTSLFVDLRPYQRGAQEWLDFYLLYSPEDVLIKGESRCITGVVNTKPHEWASVDQTQIIANMQLRRGWNALLRRRTSLDTIPLPTPHNAIQSVMRHEWQVLPESALRNWRVGSGY